MCVFFRDSDHHERSTFSDIAAWLAVDDDQLLVNRPGEETVTGLLGDELQVAENMYRDLQQMYATNLVWDEELWYNHIKD